MDKKIQRANSYSRGIKFYSNKIPGLSVFTFYNEDNNIVSKLEYNYYNEDGEEETIVFNDSNNDYNIEREKRLEEDKKGDAALSNSFNYVLKILFPICYVIMLVITIVFHNITLTLAFMYLFITGAMIRMLLFLNFIRLYKFKNAIHYDVSKFHAAEHRAINEYEKNQRIPTIEEVRNSSNYNPACGSRIEYMPIIADIVSLFVVCITGHIANMIISYFAGPSGDGMGIFTLILTIFFIIEFFIVEVFMVAFIFRIPRIEKANIFKYMQFFFTNNPTDKELILSVIAIENFQVMEDAILKPGILNRLNFYKLYRATKYIFEDVELNKKRVKTLINNDKKTDKKDKN